MASDLSARRPSVDPEARARVQAWVLEAFGLPADAFVRVTQLACSEPGCPPLETAIALDREGGISLRTVHKATSEISREDVFALAQAKEGS